MTIRTEKPESKQPGVFASTARTGGFVESRLSTGGRYSCLFGIGYGIDYVAHTSPVLCIAFSIIGIAAGLYLVIRSEVLNSHKQKRRT